MEELRFDLDRKELPIVLEGASERLHLVLRELTGKDRDKYLSSLSGRMRFDASGQPIGLKSFDGLQSGLLSLCLYDDQGNRIKRSSIEEWPASTQTRIFEKAQEINALNQEAVDLAGND